jgi:hypothetical protein
LDDSDETAVAEVPVSLPQPGNMPSSPEQAINSITNGKEVVLISYPPLIGRFIPFLPEKM